MDATAVDLAGLTARLLQEAGLSDADEHRTGWALAEAAARLGPRTNRMIAFRPAAEAGLPPADIAFPRHFRPFAPPSDGADLPPGFAARAIRTEMDDLRVQRIPNGLLLHLAHGVVVLTGDAKVALRDFSGRFAALVNYVDIDLRAILRRARRVPGTVFVLGDEIQPVNYCHWLLDFLPRLDVLRRLGIAAPVSVAVPPLAAPFQRETLHLCGVDDAHIVELGPLQALRADTLLATSDVWEPPHPAFKGAGWALRFVRRHVGGGCVSDEPSDGRGRRLYVSRADSGGRRIVNETDLVAGLRPLGFEPVRLTGMTAREQTALFADAACIVGLHGAGLANAVFARPGTALLELFPRSYGTAAYYLLARGAQLRYEHLVLADVVPGSRPQLDDVRADIAALVAKCREMLG